MAKHKYIETPELLWQYWQEYKEEVDGKPDVQQVATGKGVFDIKVKKPYLRQGFEAYVYRTYGFHVHHYLDNMDGSYDEYWGVVTHIRNEWQTDQLEGTITGRYKAPNLIARLNGLADKMDNKTDGKVEVVVTYENKHNTQSASPESGQDAEGC